MSICIRFEDFWKNNFDINALVKPDSEKYGRSGEEERD